MATIKKTEILKDFGTQNVAFSQTSKGLWYCSGMSIYCDSIMDGIAVAEKAISEINKLLLKTNKGTEEDDKQ